MEKQSLEHIAYYYPHKVKIIHNNDGVIREIQYLNSHSIEVAPPKRGYKCMSITQWHNETDNFKLLLLPMDLSKPIIVDGKEIIPIVELAKIAFPNEKIWTIESEEEGIVSCMDFDFGYISNSFKSSGYMYKSVHVPSQLILFQWLLKHKFDVFGLIEKGLAIDANTLTTNPYD